MFLPQETIRRKRDGLTLAEDEIDRFVAGLVDGSVGDGQAAAFAMAVLFRGMALAERVALTRAMTRSGMVLDWAGAAGPVLDKHSTGGVGDTVSLILAPVVAACGGIVPMISGRGLGHTGGTLDKMQSIPGYDAQPGLDRLRAAVAAAGCAIVGATPDLAPADRRLYAIRDVTATVESIDLICASILSKKLAAGLQGLVLDVKTGSGAFMRDMEAAEALAHSLVEVADGAGLPTVALLTDMNAVLGHCAGNALEVREAVDLLAGRAAVPRLWQVTRELCAEMLVLGGLAATRAEGRDKAQRALDSGEAAVRFARMVAALGGPTDIVERPDRHLRRAPVVRAVTAARDAHVAAIDVRALGLAVVALGGGRTRPTDAIDPTVGLDLVAGLGERVGPGGAILARVHAADAASAEAGVRAVRAAVTLDATAHVPRNPVAGRIAAR